MIIIDARIVLIIALVAFVLKMRKPRGGDNECETKRQGKP